MHIKKTAGITLFSYGIVSVMADCDEIRTGWDEDTDNRMAMYAHTPTGGYISHKYDADSKDDAFVALLYGLCQNMMYCANQPLVDGRCLEEGTEFIQPYLADGDTTETVMALGAFINNLIREDNVMISKNSNNDDDDDEDEDTARLDSAFHGHIPRSDKADNERR